ncbi:MAG: AmmeMemoRadiSam system protein B [Candidatus Margulisiibacteriota bacterium]|jgi:hypothetical protein
MPVWWRVIGCWCLLVCSGYALDFHYSKYAGDPEKYLKPIREYQRTQASQKIASGKILAGILPHHFLASDMMVDFFERIKRSEKPKTIILIGPNHFKQGNSAVSISSLPWKTPFGIVQSAPLGIKEDPLAFSGEHSVGVIIPFIKYYFPESKIIPILIRGDASLEEMQKLKNKIEKTIDEKGDVLILLSADFSHNSTAQTAEIRDKKSKAVITAMDPEQVFSAEIDCWRGLWLLISLIKYKATPHFIGHSNSERIAKLHGQKDVTSYFTVLFVVK